MNKEEFINEKKKEIVEFRKHADTVLRDMAATLCDNILQMYASKSSDKDGTICSIINFAGGVSLVFEKPLSELGVNIDKTVLHEPENVSDDYKVIMMYPSNPYDLAMIGKAFYKK